MNFKLSQVAGDASFRKFYRVKINKKSIIIVLAKKEKYKNLIVYCAINKFLRNHKILTPRLLYHNYKNGIIYIEDFGNLTFHKVLINKKNKLIIYKKIVDLLLKIQKIKTPKRIKDISRKNYHIEKYSTKNLHKESDLFFDWYLPLIFTKKKTIKIKKKMKKILSKLYKKLFFSNSCFVHRDFHVQNLMKKENQIGVIDTQDALIGNPAYDLASLIDDVRINTSKKLKKQVYEYYVKKSSYNLKIDQKNFLQDFKILSVQRSLKIIGIFSRLFKRDKKQNYLKLIPYTWRLLEMRMDSNIFYELKNILDRNINKKIRKKILYK